MLLTILAGALLAPSPVIVEGSRGADADRRLLTRAMSAPVAPRRRGRTRYCYDQTITDPTVVQRVCRTRSAWLRLGVEPVA